MHAAAVRQSVRPVMGLSIRPLVGQSVRPSSGPPVRKSWFSESDLIPVNDFLGRLNFRRQKKSLKE